MASVSASILACDQMRIGEQVQCAVQGGTDYFHVDIMDGDYVRNLAFSPQTVRDLKKITTLPVSVHLEVKDPEGIAPLFFGTGADMVTFQMDACSNPIHLLERIRKNGIKAGLGIGPAYHVENIRYLLEHIDWLILMSVEPGYGGQRFESSVLDKIRMVKKMMKDFDKNVPISVDGGIDTETGRLVLSAGADVLISGSWLFSGDTVAKTKMLKSL